MKKQRFRKKYTPESAKERIEVLQMSLSNYVEEANYWIAKDDTLILALTHQTRTEALAEAYRMVNRIKEEIDYVRGFLT